MEQPTKKVTKKQNKAHAKRDIKQLIKMRKILRKELSQSTDIKERQQLKARIRIIKELNRQE